MKFRLSKLAIAFACLHGSINIDATANDNYIEDQSAFNQVASELTQGWHWGMSRASACDHSGHCENDSSGW